MQRQLRTSSKAYRQFGKIAAYVGRSFGTFVLENYIASWQQFKVAVKANPLQYPFYDELRGKRYHKAVLQNLTVILFTFDDEQVMVEAIYDARLDWQRKVSEK